MKTPGQFSAKLNRVEACECFGQAFIVADEASVAGSPGEGAFDDPTPGQEDEAALGLVVADDLELNAVPGGSLGGLRTSIALVHEGDLDALAGGILDGVGQGL